MSLILLRKDQRQMESSSSKTLTLGKKQAGQGGVAEELRVSQSSSLRAREVTLGGQRK